MENKSITFTIPLIPALLRSMADMLRSLAGDNEEVQTIGFHEPSDGGGNTYRFDPKSTEADNGGEDLTVTSGKEGAETTAQELTPEPDADPGTTPPPPAGVELADGIPWDARIHSGAKTKYAKEPHGWKLKRGVDKTLVEQVEAELRAVMDIPSPAADEATTAADAFGLADVPKPPEVDPMCEGCNRGPAECVACKAASETPKACPTSFMELNVAITTSAVKIEPAAIEAAVKNAGLPAYHVLNNRPDLVPQIAKELGLC